MINKKKLERLIPFACEVLQKGNLTILDPVTKTCSNQYRSAISSFGAAVTMGSLNAAVCYLREDKSDKCNRPELLRALYMIVKGKILDDCPTAQVVGRQIAQDRSPDKEDKYLTAAVALKLALNLFIKEEKENKQGKKEESHE